jgi:hypothetical protein
VNLRTLQLLLLFVAPAVAQQPPIAVVGVDVLTMEDGASYRRRQTVLIDGDAITALGPNVTVPANARRIDGSGMVLLPGLMDMHVHLEADPAGWIGSFLGYGVTTVLNLRGNPSHLELRERIKRGELPGPRVYTSGPYVNRPEIETEQQAAAAARTQKAAGYDLLKIHGPLGSAAYRTLIDTAHALRLAVVGHAPRSLPFDSVIAVKQDMVAHAEELIYTKFTTADTTHIGDLPARMAAARIWLIATLSTFHGITAQWGRQAGLDSALKLPEAAVLNDDLRRYWTQSNPYIGRPAAGAPGIFRNYLFQKPLVRRLHAAGVRLMTGTDTPVPVMIPGPSLHLEIAELNDAGLSKYDALIAATRNPGDFIREKIDPGMRIGRVVPGYRADLLLVRGDPLNDLSVLMKPAGVISRGQYFDAARLTAFRANGR